MIRSKSMALHGAYEYHLDEDDDKIIQAFIAFMQKNGKKNLSYFRGGLFAPHRGGKFDLTKLVAALTDTRGAWDEKHDQKALCHNCGHSYYRHFDTYADMEPVGCKYCQCERFVEPPCESSPTKKSTAKSTKSASGIGTSSPSSPLRISTKRRRRAARS